MTIVAETLLGHYEILSPLGAGGMGEVAVKILPASFAQDSDNCVLVFDPSLERQRRRYRWVERRGQQINSLDEPAGNTGPWLSPDEKHFIADPYDPKTSNYDLFLCDISGASLNGSLSIRQVISVPYGSRMGTASSGLRIVTRLRTSIKRRRAEPERRLGC